MTWSAASRGLKVLLEPWLVTPTLRVGFYEYADGTVVELAEERAASALSPSPVGRALTLYQPSGSFTG